MRGDYFPADDGFVKLVRHEPLGYGLVAVIGVYDLGLTKTVYALESTHLTPLSPHSS